MMKLLFLFLLLISLQTNAQNPKNVDSLFLVKDYLLEIQNTVNSKQIKQEKISKLDSLIRLATRQKTVFDNSLDYIVKNKKESDDMKTSFNFILQSMVLYKSDIKVNSKNDSEKKYLNQNIPPLIDRIIFHSKRFEENIDFKTH